MRSRRTLAATFVTLALVTAACGDDADDAAPADTEAVTEESAAETTVADTMEEAPAEAARQDKLF